jgi:hypothetical protein
LVVLRLHQVRKGLSSPELSGASGTQGRYSCVALWNAFQRVAAGCSAAEKQALFPGTAANYYRLG